MGKESSIIPPEKENPLVVGALIRGRLSLTEMLYIVLLDLIRKRKIDIIESKGAVVLFLRNRRALASYEKTLIELLFGKNRKADLSKFAEKIAQSKSPAYNKLKQFEKEVESYIYKRGLGELWDYGRLGKNMQAVIVLAAIFVVILSLCFLMQVAQSNPPFFLFALAILIGILAFLINASRKLSSYATPPPSYEEKYKRWKAFEKAVRESRIRTYPPSAVALWEEILVYASALGLAEEVEERLSALGESIREEVFKIKVLKENKAFERIREIEEKEKRANPPLADYLLSTQR